MNSTRFAYFLIIYSVFIEILSLFERVNKRDGTNIPTNNIEIKRTQFNTIENVQSITQKPYFFSFIDIQKRKRKKTTVDTTHTS